MKELRYIGKGRVVSIEDPTSQDVETYIRQLDKRQRRWINISSHVSDITLVGTGTSRLCLNYHEYGVLGKWGWLSDGDFDEPDDDQEVKILRYLISNGQMDIIALHKTVAVEFAIEVCAYFVYADEMPPDLRWYLYNR